MVRPNAGFGFEFYLFRNLLQETIRVQQLLKSQIPSPKFQINLKLQYPMTKTGKLVELKIYFL